MNIRQESIPNRGVRQAYSDALPVSGSQICVDVFVRPSVTGASRARHLFEAAASACSPARPLYSQAYTIPNTAFHHPPNVSVGSVLTRRILRLWCLAEGVFSEEKEERLRFERLIIEGYHRDATARIKSVAALDENEPITLWGDLLLQRFRHISRFPEGLIVEGNVKICDCPSLVAIAYVVKLSGSLTITNCSVLKEIGGEVDIGGDFFLTENESIERVSDELWVGGMVAIHRCHNLIELATSARIGADLIVERADSLVALTSQLRVGGNLTIHACCKFLTTPDNMVVGGDVHFAFVTNFSSFGTHTAIGGRLDLRRCSRMRALPEDLQVGREINLHGCSRFTSLPFDLTGWGSFQSVRLCVVDLRGTDLSTVMLWRLVHGDLPKGLTLRLDAMTRQRAQDVRCGHLAVRFSSLEEMLFFFWHLGGQLSLGHPPTRAELEALFCRKSLLLTFAAKIFETADFQQKPCRRFLAGKVFIVMRHLAQAPTLLSAACEAIDHGIQTCGDRLMMTLNDLEIMLWVFKAEQNLDGASDALRALGLSLMRRDLVQAYVREHYFGEAPLMRTPHEVDESEVMLYFETRLRDRLALPVSAENMLFPKTAGVEETSLDDVCNRVEHAMSDLQQCEQYLQAWRPWQKCLRHFERENWVYASAPIVSWPEGQSHASLRCPITLISLTDLERPLVYKTGESFVVYEADSLLSWYVAHGFEPSTRAQVTLASFGRLSRADDASRGGTGTRRQS